MRIWTIHPRHLDRQGLVALWREGLLAQKVLLGRTRGYRNHPQLERFKKHPRPVAAIATYLIEVCSEAERRGYMFNRKKIRNQRTRKRITGTTGQLFFEWGHLKKKLRNRRGNPSRIPPAASRPTSHPFFRIVPGNIEPWEKISHGRPKSKS